MTTLDSLPETDLVGGRQMYGISAGILLLDARIPRVPGDVGNAATWPFAVQFRVVRGATPDRILPELDRDHIVPLFLEAARELEASGVRVVGAGCGFTLAIHDEIQDGLGVPFVSSSLLQLPLILRMLPRDRAVGVLTIREGSLGPDLMTHAGVTDLFRVAVFGMEHYGGYFSSAFIGDETRIDFGRVRAEHIQAAKAMYEERPDLGAIVLECTNMPPYAADIQRVTGLPVYDFTTALDWAVRGAERLPFRGRAG